MDNFIKYIEFSNDQLHIFLIFYLKRHYNINANGLRIGSNESRSELIDLLERMNKEGNKILIKNIKTNTFIDFRTSIYLLNQIYIYDNNIGERHIKARFFESYLSDLMYLVLLIKEYIKANKSFEDLEERFFQDIYFIFKFLDKDLPPDFNRKVFFEMNKFFKILTLHNCLSQTGNVDSMLNLTEETSIKLLSLDDMHEVKEKPQPVIIVQKSNIIEESKLLEEEEVPEYVIPIFSAEI